MEQEWTNEPIKRLRRPKFYEIAARNIMMLAEKRYDSILDDTQTMDGHFPVCFVDNDLRDKIYAECKGAMEVMQSLVDQLTEAETDRLLSKPDPRCVEVPKLP